MSETNFWIKFVLAALATWRITHLLTNEDGPADLVVRLRARLGSNFAGKLMDCFYCLSFWVAVPLACVIGGNLVDLLLIWVALSGTACLLQRMGNESMFIQPLAPINKGDSHHGMLWPETSRDQEHIYTDEPSRIGND